LGAYKNIFYYSIIMDLNFDDWNDKKNWKCSRCDIKFTNDIEWIFHRKVNCPNMTRSEKRHAAPNGRYEDTKKNRQCYRCGRYGHYYRLKECYAFKDSKGNDITWGEREIPHNISKPPAKTWITTPGWTWPSSSTLITPADCIPVHAPVLPPRKEHVYKTMIL
jgi:hypothetical protein